MVLNLIFTFSINIQSPRSTKTIFSFTTEGFNKVSQPLTGFAIEIRAET